MLLNISDYRQAAQRRLPRGLFDFLERGSEDDRAVEQSRSAWHSWRLRPRILAGAAPRTVGTSLFGRARALPVGLAPVGIAAYLWHEGEAALARAASATDIPFILSGATTTRLDRFASFGDGDRWFQLYVSGDRERTFDLVRRVQTAGFTTLVLTVDSLTPYKREFAARSGFDIPFRLSIAGFADMAAHPRWLLGTIGRYALDRRFPGLAEYPIAPPGDPMHGRFAFKDDSLDWQFLAQLRSFWAGRLVVKGVLDHRDARLCVDHGVEGIVVSNHGGIALDASVGPIDVLEGVVAEVAGRAAVIIDGGVTRGSDVVKAYALGADFVLLGRAAMYGLAAAGEQGVRDVLGILAAEIDRTLAQIGCRSLADLTRDHVVRPSDQTGTAVQRSALP